MEDSQFQWPLLIPNASPKSIFEFKSCGQLRVCVCQYLGANPWTNIVFHGFAGAVSIGSYIGTWGSDQIAA